MKRILFSLLFISSISLRAAADPPGNADSTPGTGGGEDVKKQQLVDDLRDSTKEFAGASYELLQCFSGYCKKARDTEDQAAQQPPQGDGSQSPAQQVDHSTSQKCEAAFKDVAAKYNDFDNYSRQTNPTWFNDQAGRDGVVMKMRAFQNKINELASTSAEAKSAKYRGDAKNCPPPDEKLMAKINSQNSSTASSKP